VDRCRVQSHYLRHSCWLVDPDLLGLCSRVPPVPVRLLHGSDDRVCPLAGAELAAARLPRARLQRIDGCGHDPAHPAMVGAMVEALDRFASSGALHESEAA
jgi:proline iminopeptidase